MTDLMEKSLQTLEFPAVLELLAAQAVSDETKERVRKIRPSTDRGEVNLLLQETTAARKMMDIHGAPALSNLRPVAASLQRAHLGGVLNTRELLQIASVLRTTRNVASYSGVGEEKTCIHSIFKSLTPKKYLEEKISGAILSEDEISDNASAELADLRRKIRVTSGKAREVLQRIISSSAAKYLQEAIITIRSNRFVVPVKAEFKGSIPGLVHDVSASGSTYFIEPMGAVKANNDLRELLSKEETEIQRILASLSREAASFREDILQNYDLLLALDLIFRSRQAVLPDERHGAKIGGGRRVRVPPRTASAAGQEKGGAHRPGIGADLRHLGYHRPQHRRQDGHPENGWPAHPHGSVWPAPASGRWEPGFYF